MSRSPSNSTPNPFFCSLLLAFLLVSTAQVADAGGLFIPGYGSQAQPRAGAFAAKADDPSAIFHNPAGLAKINGTMVQLGFNLVNFSQRFKRAGTYDNCTDPKCPVDSHPFAGQEYKTIENQSHGAAHLGDFAIIPLFSAASNLGLDLPIVFAAGVFVPGVGSQDREYAPDYQLETDPTKPSPPGRYDLIRQEIIMLMPSLAVAYKINSKIDVGARISWGYAHIKAEVATWGFTNYEEWEGKDVNFAVDVKDKFVPSFGIGALYRPTTYLELGFNFRSASSIRAKGTGITTSGTGTLLEGLNLLSPKSEAPYDCAPGGTIAVYRNCLELEIPRVATMAARWILRDKKGGEKADVEFDVQWENWSAASDTVNIIDATAPTLRGGLPQTVSKHGYVDVFSFRLGGHYAIPVSPSQTLSIRSGIAYDTKTAPKSWTRLDQDGFARTTAGLGIALDIPGFRFELSGGAVLEGSRNVDHEGCNPTKKNIGCRENKNTPVADRKAPDPAQPIVNPGNVVQSPFNAGIYEQGYIFLGGGITAWF